MGIVHHLPLPLLNKGYSARLCSHLIYCMLINYNYILLEVICALRALHSVQTNDLNVVSIMNDEWEHNFGKIKYNVVGGACWVEFYIIGFFSG